MGENPDSGEEYRYERKFLIEGATRPQVQTLVRIHPAMFIQPYPPRYVNNFYLDTEELENYYDNMSGRDDRQKFRIRWYGTCLGAIDQPVLEIKIKRGLVGTKEHYPLPPFFLDERFSVEDYCRLLRRSGLPYRVRSQLSGMHVVLLNRYYRDYYATRDNHFRVTIDTGLTYFRVDRGRNTFNHKQVDRTNLILELKYDKAKELEANRVSGFFPYPVTKNSKYVSGIERVFF